MICPRCKEDMPLLSKICPVCGYVVESADGNVSADAFVKKLEDNLLELKRLPEPSVGNGLMSLTYIVYPVITFFTFLLAVLTEAGLFWIVTFVFAIMSVVKIVKKLKGKSAVDVAERQFKDIKLTAERNEREAKRNYGKNREVALLIDDISAQITKVEETRKKQKNRNLLIWIGILIIILGLMVMSVLSVGESINEEEQAKTEQFEEIF